MRHHVNLIPWEFHRKTILRSLVRRWRAPWVAVLLAMGVHLVTSLQELRSVRQQAASWEGAAKSVQEARAELSALQQETAWWRARVAAVQQLSAGLRPTAVLRLVVAALKESNAPIELESVSCQEIPRNAAQENVPPGSMDGKKKPSSEENKVVPRYVVELTGRAPSAEAVARLCMQLRRSQGVLAVEIKKLSRQAETPDSESVSFTLQVNV
jgi:hypothetical protein